MSIDKLTIGELKELKGFLGGDAKNKKSISYEVGKSYLIETVTKYYLGRVKEITDYEIVLENAAWIADTGRYSTALEKGLEGIDNSEIEIITNNPAITITGIIMGVEYSHKLPTTTK